MKATAILLAKILHSDVEKSNERNYTRVSYDLESFFAAQISKAELAIPY